MATLEQWNDRKQIKKNGREEDKYSTKNGAKGETKIRYCIKSNGAIKQTKEVSRSVVVTRGSDWSKV
jgi:hypothetical protein